MQPMMSFEQARDILKDFDRRWPNGRAPIDQHSLRTMAALRVAMELVGNYQSDIANWIPAAPRKAGQTLEEQGFCQGEFYKDCQKLLKPWEQRLT